MSTGLLRAFRPVDATVKISVASSAATTPITGLQSIRSLRLFNAGSETVFISFIGTKATGLPATVNDSLPLPAGQTEVFTIAADVTGISTIAATTSSTLYMTVGEGL